MGNVREPTGTRGWPSWYWCSAEGSDEQLDSSGVWTWLRNTLALAGANRARPSRFWTFLFSPCWFMEHWHLQHVWLWSSCCRGAGGRRGTSWSWSSPPGREGPVGGLCSAEVPGHVPADLAAAAAGPAGSPSLHLPEPQPVGLVQQLRKPGRAGPGQEGPGGRRRAVQDLQRHVDWNQKPEQTGLILKPRLSLVCDSHRTPCIFESI